MHPSTLSIAPLLRNWRTLAFAGALGLVLAVLVSFVRPLEYSSSTRLLITQELGDVDAYTSARSTERIADILSSVVYSTDVFDKVLSSGYPIDEAFFPADETKRRKKWENAVVTSVSRSNGYLTITAYHPDVAQAEEFVRAVAYILSTDGWQYVSGGNISVRIIDDPLNSRYPVRPNLIVNGVSGFVLGILAGAGYILIMTERLRLRHQVVHEG